MINTTEKWLDPLIKVGEHPFVESARAKIQELFRLARKGFAFENYQKEDCLCSWTCEKHKKELKELAE